MACVSHLHLQLQLQHEWRGFKAGACLCTDNQAITGAWPGLFAVGLCGFLVSPLHPVHGLVVLAQRSFQHHTMWPRSCGQARHTC